jgi:RimJ/RimL family protein N-acetyltransferase
MTNRFLTPKGEINLRLAAPDDAAAVRELRLEALSLHPEAFSADLTITAAEGAEVWAERIAGYQTSSSGAICIASFSDGLIGMTGIGRGHWPKTQHFATIWGVFVSPEWRGYHIAEQLFTVCFDWAKGEGVTVINLGVNISNVNAIRCYSRCGFTIYGVEPRAIYLHDIYYDELLMSKLID